MIEQADVIAEQRKALRALREVVPLEQTALAEAKSKFTRDQEAARSNAEAKHKQATLALLDLQSKRSEAERLVANGNLHYASRASPEPGSLSPWGGPQHQIRSYSLAAGIALARLRTKKVRPSGQIRVVALLLFALLALLIFTALTFQPSAAIDENPFTRRSVGELEYALIAAGAALPALVFLFLQSRTRSSAKSAFGVIADATACGEACHKLWLEEIHNELEASELFIQSRYNSETAAITDTFSPKTTKQLASLIDVTTASHESSPAWTDTRWSSKNWVPSTVVLPYVRVGSLDATGEPYSLPDSMVLPALIPFPGDRSLLFMATGEAKDAALAAIQSLLLRLLATIPPGKVQFTLIDPQGLGQGAAPLLPLGDHDARLINGKVWSEPKHIDERLAALTEHIELVIQKYLRNDFVTIEAHNVSAGEVAEPYRVLLVLDFPTNFTENTAQRLISIAQKGPRCGVFTVVLVDTAQKVPHGVKLAELERSSSVIAWDNDRFVWQDADFKPCRLHLDTAPPANIYTQIVKNVGAAANAAGDVQVPFERVAPAPEDWWTGDSRHGLQVALGPSGARKLQYLELGTGKTAPHVLVAGRTGSGKSALLHTLTVNLALTYSPDEVELYLIDFKKGVEFKTYATHQLPHARVVAVESEREFGLSVLQKLDAELKERGDAFRASGTSEVEAYRRKTGQQLPRVLLLVDEFQEFFTEDDPISSQSSQILDRLVRQGRAFGIHLLLVTQTLAGAYALARSTISQMGIRIALQCSEADSRLILADDNPAARLLTRPGEAIYNAANGMVEGNNRFQVAWLANEQRDDYLVRLQKFARDRQYQPPQPQITFAGDELASIERNVQLERARRESPPSIAPRVSLAWLGDPIAIRESVAARFLRQSGGNLLIVGQDVDAVLGMMAVALVSLSAQLPAGGRQATSAEQRPAFYLLDFGAIDAPSAEFFDRHAAQSPTLLKLGRRRHLTGMLAELAAELQRRLDIEEPSAPPLYLFVYGLHRARDLRPDENIGFGSFGGESAAPNPAQQFAALLRDGPDVGIHSVVWCDTMTNLNRSLDRRALREFTTRVVLQMSAEDSSNLIDTPAASKLGSNRALFYNEEEGRLEKFRPYGLPSERWLARPQAVS